MNTLLNIENLAIITLLLLVAVIVLIVVFVRYAKAVNTRLAQSIKLINDLYQLSQNQEEQIRALDTNSHASSSQLFSSIEAEVSEIRQQLDTFSHELRQVENQTQQLQHEDPALRMYSKANELVAAGASIDDIIQACELPRAEAEILVGFHRTKHS